MKDNLSFFCYFVIVFHLNYIMSTENKIASEELLQQKVRLSAVIDRSTEWLISNLNVYVFFF